MQSRKLPLGSLPLPPASRLLTHNLTPDPVAPNPGKFLKLLQESPSVQRRARLLDSSAHFSYVTPLPLSFPYRIEFPEGIEDKRAFIEAWLNEREATEIPESLSPASSPSPEDYAIILQKYTSEARIQERELLGVATRCVEDCFPQLDIGDSLDVIGEPLLTAKANPKETPNEDVNKEQLNSSVPNKDGSTISARQELIDILSGHTVLASYPDTPEDIQGYAPWSLRYSGHQFGQWAGQLGDGRAISILEVANPNSPSGLYELQLKGAGRTPFSRSADGLAVVRSSIREYLCAEAMHALGIPTTRSLAIMSIPTLPVQREQMEKAAIVTRVAPSFLRIGSFQALNPPEQMFFLGGGQQAADLEALCILGEYVSQHVLKLDLKGDEPWGEKLVLECARRNALMVAGWQAYGFMHGVINTDNVSIMGLTIDYGPYAFMDVFDPAHICNHSDDAGRYSFKLQPTMIIFALRALLSAMAPLIGAEKAKQGRISRGWTANVADETIAQWTKAGLEIQPEMESKIMSEFQTEYHRLMRKRLGLVAAGENDYQTIILPLLNLLERKELDYPSTLRHLTRFKPTFLLPENANKLQGLLKDLNGTSQCIKPGEEQAQHHDDWVKWLTTFAARIDEDKKGYQGPQNEGEWLQTRASRMEKANPRFILRQWVLEEVIKNVEQDPISGRAKLAKVLEMASNPFERWGAEGQDSPETSLTDEIREELRYCGMGDTQMLGFQCSCSS